MTKNVFIGRTVFAVTLERGADVFAKLTELLTQHSINRALIHAHGTLNAIEVREGQDPAFAFTSMSRIVSFDGYARTMKGQLQLTFSATVAASSLGGTQFITGSVERAIANQIHVFIVGLDAYTPSIPSPGPTKSGSSKSRAPKSLAPKAESDSPELLIGASSLASLPTSWAAVAAASLSSEEESAKPQPSRKSTTSRPPAAKRSNPPVSKKGTRTSMPSPALAPPATPTPPKRPSSINFENFPEAGDYVDHFSFGRCLVLRSDGDELIVQDMNTSRTRTLRISMLQQNGPFEDNGRRVFQLTQKRS